MEGGKDPYCATDRFITTHTHIQTYLHMLRNYSIAASLMKLHVSEILGMTLGIKLIIPSSTNFEGMELKCYVYFKLNRITQNLNKKIKINNQLFYS